MCTRTPNLQWELYASKCILIHYTFLTATTLRGHSMLYQSMCYPPTTFGRHGNCSWPCPQRSADRGPGTHRCPRGTKRTHLERDEEVRQGHFHKAYDTVLRHIYNLPVWVWQGPCQWRMHTSIRLHLNEIHRYYHRLEAFTGSVCTGANECSVTRETGWGEDGMTWLIFSIWRKIWAIYDQDGKVRNKNWCMAI